MTIQTVYAPIAYAGDGVATNFAITFPYQLASDIVVQTQLVSTGAITLLVYGTDYTLTPTTNSPADVGTVSVPSPVPTGTDLLISRAVPYTQLTHWTPNDPNPSTAIENAVDKLTMEVQQILTGAIPSSVLGSGTPTTDTFLRGDRTWSSTLVGSVGFTVPTDTTAMFTAGQGGNASIRVVGGSSAQSAFSFAVDGSANAWDARWVYDPGISSIGWQFFGGSILGTFTTSGLSISGSYTGHANASLIDSGVFNVARLGSGSGSANTFLNGVGVFTIPAGGGGVNTTTTGTFTIAAVNSTQTVPVTATTGITIGTYLQISDGTHTINGLVTNIASLNLTVKTNAIILGTAGNTMASGAAVQLATAPGNNSIQVTDAATAPTAMATMQLAGDTAGSIAGAGPVELFFQNQGGGTLAVEGYLNVASIDPSVFPATAGGVGVGLIGTADVVADTNAKYIVGTAKYQVPVITGFGGSLPHHPINIAWQLLDANSITPGSLTPALLFATNSATDTYVPSYDNASGHFKWVTNTSLPANTNAGQFLNGLGAYSNVLDISASSGEAANLFLLGWGDTNGSFGAGFGINNTGTQAFWSAKKRISGTWQAPAGVTTNYVVGNGLDVGVLSANATWTSIDGTSVETFYTDKMMRTDTGLRSKYGLLSKVNTILNPAASQTIDLANGAYQQLYSFTNSVTIVLADSTPLPSNGSFRYAGELTLELINIQQISTFDITWPTITWTNTGTAPTVANGGLSANGTNVIKLIRTQATSTGLGARWLGFVENPTGTTYTDAQARTAVLQTSHMIDSSTIAMNVSAGTSVTPAVINSSLTNTHISPSAAISASKLAGFPSNSALFLNGAGAWTVPPGGGGGSFSPANPYTWTGIQSFTNTGSFSAKQVFSGPQTFNSNGFGPSVGNNAVGAVSFNNYYPNDNLAPETACAARITLVNSYVPGVNEELTALCVSQTNQSAATNGQGTVKFSTTNLQNITGGFSISFQQLASQRRINGGAGDGVWLNSWSPCVAFQSTPDADGITHSFGSGFVRAGEVNFGNAWQDFGRMEDRLGSHFVCGLELIPDWLASSTGATSFQKFNASWALSICAAAAGSIGTAPQLWTGILMCQDSLVGGASTYGAGGFGVNIRGGSTSALAPAIGVKVQDHIDIALDTSSATITPETTSTHSNQAAIQLAQGQAICFKPPTGANTGVYIVYDGTHLKATVNGGNSFTNII